MAIEWRKDLEVGVKEIDDQHRELFRRFNALLDSCNQGKGKEEVLKVLMFLNDYIRSHFDAEERLQRQVSYPGYTEHRAQHQEFVRHLRDLEDGYNRDGASTSLVIRMNQLVVSWLIQHISKKDRDIAGYVTAAAPSA
jgi:hemerythrin